MVNNMSIGFTTPVFRIFDEAKAKEFYVDFLGFAVEWEHRFEDDLPLYLEIEKDSCKIHLTEHHGDCCPGAAVRIETSGLEKLYQDLNAEKYGFSRPSIEDTPWGAKEMSIMDPFGNRLTFVETDAD